MRLNMSTPDRLARIVIAGILAALAIVGAATGTFAVVAWVLAALMLGTAAVGFCPLYAILRFSTRSAGR